MTNYFEFYNIEEAIDIDLSALKKEYYRISREYHPDFYTQEIDIDKEKAERISSINNDAYRVLKNQNSRIHHILEIHDAMEEEGKNQVPQAFLMEMMDINEIIMELEFDYSEEENKKATDLVSEMEKNMSDELETIKSVHDKDTYLAMLKDYYLKMQYLKRIKENLAKLAPA